MYTLDWYIQTLLEEEKNLRFQAAELFAAGWLGQLEGYPVGCEVWRGTSLLLAFKVSGKVVNKWVGSSPAAVRGAVEGRRRHI